MRQQSTTRPPSTTPAAIAMRRLRARRRANEELASRMEQAQYIYCVERHRCGKSGQVWTCLDLEGRIQVGKKPFVVARSIAKHGPRGAYLQCLNYVAKQLLKHYPADQVARKVQALHAAAPQETA